MNKGNLRADLFPLFKPEPPFMPFSSGFGYYGVILQSRENGKIQCHLCGRLLKSVAKHLYHKHDISCDEYREMTGLNKFTPLVCENTSQLIRNTYNNLSRAERKERIELLIKNNKKVHRSGLWKPRKTKSRVQYNNKNGTCDLQAKELFWKEYKAIGRIPFNSEMSTKLKYLIYDRFGSYDRALKAWGVDEKEINGRKKLSDQKALEARKKCNFFPKYDIQTLKNQLVFFYKENKRLPSWTEIRRNGFPCRSVFFRAFGSIKKEEIERQIILLL